MINCDDIKTPDQWHAAMRALAKQHSKVFDDTEAADPKAGKAKQAAAPDTKSDAAAMDETDQHEPDDDDDEY